MSGAAVVTVGEGMALLEAPASGRLGPGAALPLGFGGTESNVAIGSPGSVCRAPGSAGWATTPWAPS